MPEKHAVIAFGRLNPPHVGHLKLANAVASHAKKVGAKSSAIYLSQSHDKKKNPLPPDVKHGVAKQVLRGHNVVSHPEVKNMFDAVGHAVASGHHHIHLVVGHDRHEEMSKKAEALKKHSGAKSVTVVNAGVRDPDSHDPVERASGTGARAAAKQGVQHFRRMMPKHLSPKEISDIHNTLSAHMESVDWFNEMDIEEFMNNPEILNEVAKYLPPDLYLVQKRKRGEIEVVVRPDPVEDTVLKGGPDKPKPAMTDIQNAIKQKKFKQTPTSIQVFGDVSKMIQDMEREEKDLKSGKKAKKDKEAAGVPSAEEQQAAEQQAAAEEQAQAEYDALDPFTPSGPAQNIDSIEYPGPMKPITQGRGVQFEWAVTYLASKSAGLSDDQLSKRNEMANMNLTAFGKDVFQLAKQTVKNIPEECRGNIKHSDEVGIFGRPEPKTDLICGENRISLKMQGDIQLSSESAATTAKTLQNLAAQIGVADNELMQKSVKNISKSLNALPNKMIDPKNLEEAMDRHSGKPWFDEMFDNNGKLKEKYDWSKYSGTVTKGIQDDFIRFLGENEQFKRHLVHEALTGQRAFADNPEASATHILTPNGYNEIGDPDGDFVSGVMPKTFVGIRAKSRSRITQPTFRFELKGNKLEITEATKQAPMDGDMAFILTPERLNEFYSQNPQEILREASSALSISVGGDTDNKVGEDASFNIIKINGKETKIPVLPEKPDFENMTPEEENMNESFDLLFEQDDPSKRDYKREYRLFHGRPEQRAKRSKRVLARRKLMKQGRVSKGDGMDVDHKDGNALNNGHGNLRVQSKSQNRANNKHRKGESAGKIVDNVNNFLDIDSLFEEHGAGEEGTDKLLKTYIKHTPHMNAPHLVSKRKK